MRLSKLQKWILLNCYRKTLLKDDTTIKESKFNKNSKTYYNYLFRAEIYYSYFNIKKYEKVPDKYRVICSRTTNNLERKGMVQVYEGLCSRWIGIKLTDKGINIVKKLYF